MFENLIGKRLLVLGGTRISCEIIRKAMSMGIVVGVTDYYPIDLSPGKQISNEAYDISTTDVHAVANLIKEKHFDGVITGFSDMLLPYYAKICDITGLPCYGTLEQFHVFTNKRKFKELCAKYGVPTIQSYDVKRMESEEIIYPVLVKPVDSSGSRGIFISNNYDELKRDIDRSLAFSKSKDVIVERYMTGREVTVTWLFVDGEYFLTGIANRHVKFYGKESIIPLPVGYTYPASITPIYRLTIENSFKKLLKSLDVKNGMLFMQCKVEGDVCYVYDVGYRLTGALEYKNYDAACGYNPLEMLINFALTGEMCKKTLLQRIQPEKMKPSYNVTFIAEPGTIKDIKGTEETLKNKQLIDIVLAHCPGETISDEMNGLLTQVTVRAFGCVENKSELYSVMKSIEDSISIISENNTEMRKRGIEEKDIEGFVL